jgi:hypothetical protein
MRRTIETAPRDGNVVIIEDDASGTYDVAHWSPEAGEWIGEKGEPIKIIPSHWYPMQGDNYLQQEHDQSRVMPTPSRRGFATSLIAATLVAAALIGMYFHAEVFAYVTRYAGQLDVPRVSTSSAQLVEQETQLPSQDLGKTGSLALLQQVEADQASTQAVAQVKQAVEAPTPEAQQPLENEQRPEVLAHELAEPRHAIERLNLQLQAEAAKTTQLLGQEREKTAALVQDVAAVRQALMASTAQYCNALEEERARSASLAMAGRQIETQVALSSKKGEEAAQLKQAAESAAAELRQSLQREHDRAETLASELASTRRDVEAQVALLSKKGDEAAQLKQAAESTIAALRQSLQQERDRTAAMARDLESARRTIDVRVTSEPAASSEISKAAGAVEVAATAQPAAAEAQGSPEGKRLIARASALLGQGDIGAARIVLERATETGSAQASFMLAETYDPGILSAWGTYGTRGEVTKAREFYARAHAGGIAAAKDRFIALPSERK